jgi:hypothetical protein
MCPRDTPGTRCVSHRSQWRGPPLRARSDPNERTVNTWHSRRSSERPRKWPGGCDEEETKQRSEPRSPQEHAMMFAFVMALVGVAVLGTMNLVAAR